ncbi:hypothetical protein [Bradyrhizobium sp. 33ap4]|uniref:hypothetical protein n=1 Tax=Bradyrhizobium sp. 33ap4 TaxID=3061630 RepID=UPI00292F0DE8|nr:hypothetical protein [Bradyrhizobium sp. 33ap4]
MGASTKQNPASYRSKLTGLVELIFPVDFSLVVPLAKLTAERETRSFLFLMVASFFQGRFLRSQLPGRSVVGTYFFASSLFAAPFAVFFISDLLARFTSIPVVSIAPL